MIPLAILFLAAWFLASAALIPVWHAFVRGSKKARS